MGVKQNSLGRDILLFVLIAFQVFSWVYLFENWRNETPSFEVPKSDGNYAIPILEENFIATNVRIKSFVPEEPELTISFQPITTGYAIQDKFKNLVTTTWPNEDFDKLDGGFYYDFIVVDVKDINEYLFGGEFGNPGINYESHTYWSSFCPDCEKAKALGPNYANLANEFTINIQPYAKGWYPFEKYIIGFKSHFTVQSFDNEDVSYDLGSPFRIHAPFSNYDFSAVYDGEWTTLIIEQNNIFKILFLIAIILFALFSTALFTIEKLSSFLEVATALLIGIWGFKEIILPDYFPFRLTYGGYLVVMLIYANLGISAIFWLINNYATNKGYKVFQPQVIQLQSSNSKHLTTKEVATLLNVSESTVYRLRKKGELTGEKVNGRRVFESKSVFDYKNNKQKNH